MRCSLAAVLFLSLAGAQSAKRPLTHQDYDGWRDIQNQRLSPDGRFLAYALFPQEGDGELVIRELAPGPERREPIGVRPPPPPPNFALPAGEEPPPPPGITVRFTADSRFAVFSTFPAKADLDRARKEKKKPEEMPKGGMVSIDLATGAVTRFPRVKNFQVPEDGNGYIAYLHEPPDGSKKDDKDKKEFGSDLTLRNLSDGSERTFPDILEYSLAKNARTLVYAVSSHTEDSNGLYAFTPGGSAPVPLLTGRGKYVKLTWNEDQNHLALATSRDDASKLYLWDRKSAAPSELVSQVAPGYVVSTKASLAFSKDGAHLFFGVSPPEKKAAAPDDDQARFDLWHWNDDFVQPMQKVRGKLERDRSYRAAWHLAEKRMVQLADPTLPEITPSEDGLWALGSDDRAYRAMVDYDTRYNDTYLVDTLTGRRTLAVKKCTGSVTWSPDGKHAIWFDGKDWNSISVPSGAVTNLTAKLGVSFANEEHDTPNPAPAYGLAGWTKDGHSVFVYDHFDVWQLSSDGTSARNLTANLGRNERLMLRYARVNPDPKEKWIDPAQPLLLRAEHADTHDTGFYSVSLDGSAPRLQLMAAKNFSPPVKARNADVLVFTASAFNEFPDLLVTTFSMADLRRVSNANPQKSQFLWGSAEMVHFENADGVPLSGVLYKPENFDPKKKYPLLVYIYERLSGEIHHFVDPRPGHSINISYYVSNGYLVFTPDIVYTIGYPGQSALKCVLSGVQAVVDRGFVDEKAIGIQGHSWGGYQIAYMITQTNRFRAVAAGAPVANMTSAYDGIRWGPGLPRQFQYEHTQSRIGGTLWQYPQRFIENSPLFMADRVQTPLLMLHNDADDAVPWYQGIEYYMALRRLGKEVYLFSYNGEPHGLRRRPNQKDYTIRLQQFFDYYLKGASKPDWMEHGIPYHAVD